MNSEQTEKIIIEALKLKDEGKYLPEILNLFPEHKEELEGLFNVADILSEEKNKITAPENLLLKIITSVDTNRFISRSEEDKGRASVNNLDQIQDSMTINWKIVFGAAVFGIIAAVVYFQFGIKPAQFAKEGEKGVALAPTGNIDDVVAILLADASSDGAALLTETDISLIDTDSQAIDDFGQSYNEEF